MTDEQLRNHQLSMKMLSSMFAMVKAIILGIVAFFVLIGAAMKKAAIAALGDSAKSGYRTYQLVLPMITMISLVGIAPVGIALMWWRKFWTHRTRIVASISSVAFSSLVIVGALNDRSRELATENQAKVAAAVANADQQKAATALAEADDARRKAAEQQQAQQKQETITKVQIAAKKLAAAKDLTPAERAAAFQALQSAIEAVTGTTAATAPEVLSILNQTAPASALLSQLHKLELADSARPDKPVYNKPEYRGAFFLSGINRGTFELWAHTIVVQQGEQFYLVAPVDPDRILTVEVKGWVAYEFEADGAIRTEDVDIGRGGRKARSVLLKDKETYDDDQRKYADDVKNAQAEYRQNLTDYRSAEATAKLDKQAQKKIKLELDDKIMKLVLTLQS